MRKEEWPERVCGQRNHHQEGERNVEGDDDEMGWPTEGPSLSRHRSLWLLSQWDSHLQSLSETLNSTGPPFPAGPLMSSRILYILVSSTRNQWVV